ncbi:hypothetical protein BDZ89DRAFT_1086394 [Hymenopellis radicata]|nr:hypothetical protein BDZ89DRAFT_1086394 [Hymenopellis radicata]
MLTLAAAKREEVPIELLTGPHILGMFLSWFLLGIITVQVYIFYLNQPEHNNGPLRNIRWFVYGLFLLEWAQTIMMTHDGFHWYVINWGNSATLNDISLIWLNVPLMGSVISCAVQLFFAWQIRQLSKVNWISGVIVLVALAHASTGIASGIKVRVLGSLSQLGTTTGLVTFTHVGEAAADIIIAGAMTFFLFRMKSGFQRTDTQITKIIRLFLETGLLTSTVAILDVIFFFLFPPNTLHEVPSLMLSKLYTNALLAMLNNRILLNGDRESSRLTSVSIPLSSSNVRRSRSLVRVDEVEHTYPPRDLSVPGRAASRYVEHELYESDFKPVELTSAATT